MNRKYKLDLLNIGAGIYGATSAYKAKQEVKHRLVIDIRPHDDVYKCPNNVIIHEHSPEWRPSIEPIYTINDDRNLYNTI